MKQKDLTKTSAMIVVIIHYIMSSYETCCPRDFRRMISRVLHLNQSRALKFSGSAASRIPAQECRPDTSSIAPLAETGYSHRLTNPWDISLDGHN